MIRLLFLEAALGVGGAERNNQRVLLGLDRTRFEPHVATLKARGPIGDELAASGVPVTENLFPSARGFLAARGSLADLCRKLRPNLLFTSDSPLPMLWGGWLRRKGFVPRYCAVFHTTNFTDKGFRRRLAWRAAVPVADRIIATGRSHVEYVHRTVGVPRQKLVNILNGVDLGRFTPPEDKAPYKRKLGFAPDTLLVGIVAALRPEKNHAMFVRTAQRLRSQFPQARFLLVGEGPERPSIEALIASLGVGNEVKLLGRRSDMPDVMSALDVITLCSKPVIETLPVCLVEADAMGLPAVSTRVGSVDDIVEEGVTGYLVEPGDEEAFAERIAALLLDGEKRKQFGAAAREQALARFDVHEMVRKYEKLFEEIVRPS